MSSGGWIVRRGGPTAVRPRSLTPPSQPFRRTRCPTPATDDRSTLTTHGRSPTMRCPRPLLAAGFTLAIALTASAPVTAQTDRGSRFMDNCRRNNWNDYAQVCEVRDYTIAGLRALVVDGRANGGISVYGWDRSDIKVVALVQAQAESEAEANDIAREISISTNNGDIRALGPTRSRRHESWSVSY